MRIFIGFCLKAILWLKRDAVKKTISLFMTAVFIISFSAQGFIYAQEKKPTIAIIDFKPLGVSASEATFITEFFRSALVTSDMFIVIDKTNMDKILAEQGFQQTGCTTQECAVKMGKILNVQEMVNGNFGKLGETYQLTVNLVDVETGQITYSDSASCDFSKELKSTTDELAYRMVNKISGKPVNGVSMQDSGYERPALKETILPAQIKTKATGEVIALKDNNQIGINLGLADGVKMYDVFTVIEPVKEISPVTGKEIVKYIDAAELEIIYVEENNSLGTITAAEPGRSFNIGSKVKKGRASMPAYENAIWMSNYTQWVKKYVQARVLAYPIGMGLMAAGIGISGFGIYQLVSRKSSVGSAFMGVGITFFIAGPVIGMTYEQKYLALKKEGKLKGYFDYYKKNRSFQGNMTNH